MMKRLPPNKAVEPAPQVGAGKRISHVSGGRKRMSPRSLWVVVIVSFVMSIAYALRAAEQASIIAKGRRADGLPLNRPILEEGLVDPLCTPSRPFHHGPRSAIPLVGALQQALDANLAASATTNVGLKTSLGKYVASLAEAQREILSLFVSNVGIATSTFNAMLANSSGNVTSETKALAIATWFDVERNARVVLVDLLLPEDNLHAESESVVYWPSHHWRTVCVVQLRRAVHRLRMRAYGIGNQSQCFFVTSSRRKSPPSWLVSLVRREMMVHQCFFDNETLAIKNLTNYMNSAFGVDVPCAGRSDGAQTFLGWPPVSVGALATKKADVTSQQPAPLAFSLTLDAHQIQARHQRALVRSITGCICSLRNHSVSYGSLSASTIPVSSKGSVLQVHCGASAHTPFELSEDWPTGRKLSIEIYSPTGHNHFRHTRQDQLVATLNIVDASSFNSRPWEALDDDTLPEESITLPHVLVYTLNVHTIVNICHFFRSSTCTLNRSTSSLLALIPGPFVPQRERVAVERSLIECAALAGCPVPRITWFRPAEDEVRHPGMSGPEYDTSPTFRNETDVPHNPMQTLKLLSAKDIQEFSAEVVLLTSMMFPVWVRNLLQPVARHPQILEHRVIRWSERTIYDPDWFYLAVPSAWALQPTMTLFESASPLRHADTRHTTLNALENATKAFYNAKKGARDTMVWAAILPGNELSAVVANEEQQELVGYDRIVNHLHRLRDAAEPQQTKMPLSPAARKSRKRTKVLGPNATFRARFGWHTENTDALSDLMIVHETSFVVRAATEVAASTPTDNASVLVEQRRDGARWVTFFHYPWVRDNMYHLHNDNILPLLLAIRREDEVRAQRGNNRKTLTCRRLVLLPTTRKQQTPLPFATDLFRTMFDQVVFLSTQSGNGRDKPTRRIVEGLTPESSRCNVGTFLDERDSSMPLLFDGPIVFGRPPRPFSTEMGNVAPYQHYRIAPLWRDLMWRSAQRFHTAPSSTDALRLFGNMDLSGAAAKVTQQPPPHEIFVTWLMRRGSRSLDSDGALLGWLALANRTLKTQYHCLDCVLRIQTCCDGLSFWEQVLIMKRTRLLIGVHGAGLLHSLFLDSTPRHVRLAHSGESLLLTPLVVHIGSAHMNYHEQTVIQRLSTLASDNATHCIRFQSTVTSPFPQKNRAASWRDEFHLSAMSIQEILDHALWLYFSEL